MRMRVQRATAISNLNPALNLILKEKFLLPLGEGQDEGQRGRWLIYPPAGGDERLFLLAKASAGLA